MLNRLNSLMLGSTIVSGATYSPVREAASKAASEPAKGEKDNTKKLESEISNKVDIAIRSSQDHGPKLQEAANASFWYGIVHGGWNEFNRLMKGVTGGDFEAIRFFVANVTNAIGVAFMNETTGKATAKMLPVAWTQTKGFHTRDISTDAKLEGVDLEEVKTAFAKIRKDMADGGIESLKQYKLAPNRQTGAGTGESYDWQEDLKKFLERAASKGAPRAQLDQIAKFNDGEHKPDIAGKYVSPEAKTVRITQGELDALKKAAEKNKANA